MNCTCMESLDKFVVEKTGDPEAKVERTWSVNFQDGKSAEYPEMRMSYRKKRGDEFTKKLYYYVLTPTYCPFCGKKAEDMERKVKG